MSTGIRSTRKSADYRIPELHKEIDDIQDFHGAFRADLPRADDRNRPQPPALKGTLSGLLRRLQREDQRSLPVVGDTPPPPPV